MDAGLAAVAQGVKDDALTYSQTTGLLPIIAVRHAYVRA
jgi:hypothetical protein